jgi:hypothetical protein
MRRGGFDRSDLTLVSLSTASVANIYPLTPSVSEMELTSDLCNGEWMLENQSSKL